MFKNTICALLLMCAYISSAQIVINEIDSDTPSTDDQEFVELKSINPYQELDGYVLVLYNGSPTSSTGNKSYYALDLDGFQTDANGLILIGASLVSPVPEIIFALNTIQNGQDAVALYLGSASDFPDQTPVTANNLIDAIVYGNNQPDATMLISVLGVSAQINESLNGAGATESIQRTSSGTYEVKAPTPGANNDGTGVVSNGISISTSLSEINEGEVLTITFTAQQTSTSNFTFSYTLNNGTFSQADYTGSLTATIPAGSITATSNITLVDDSLDEGDELMIISLGQLPTEYSMLNNNIEVRIIDNDFTAASWGTPVNPTYGMVSSTAPAGYYASLEGKSGAVLKQAIQDIIANPATVRAHNYGDVTLILNDADENPLNSNEVWLMYSEEGRAKYKFQSTASSIGSWNREHIYPQSRGGFANATSSTADGINIWSATSANDLGAGHADAHHLRAEDGPENSSRNNRDFGSDYNGPAGNAGSWKGDVARSVFYMAVRYNGLEVVNGDPADNIMYQLGDLASMLQWNQTDPSDDFEMNRNNVVYTWQNNRNPFIDYPLLANYIWGSNAGETWSFSLATQHFDSQRVFVYPNPARDLVHISGITTQSQVEIYNISGARLLQSQVVANEPIQINLPTGMYFVKIYSEGASSVKKLLIN